MRWFRFLLGAALLAALMLALAPLAERQISPQLASYWQNQVLGAADADVPEFLRALAHLKAPGIRALVELIGSDRAVVRGTAQKLLEAEVFQSLRVDGPERTERLDALVQGLANEVEHYGPAGRQFAENIVRQLLDVGTSERPCLSESALPACERVLDTIDADHRLWRLARQDPSPTDVDAVLAPYKNLAAGEQPAPPEVEEQPAPPEIEAVAEPEVEANASEPMRILPPDSEDAQAMEEEPETLDLDDDPMRELPEIGSHHHAGDVRQLKLTQPATAELGAGDPAPMPAGPPEESKIIVWIRQLRDADPHIVHQAEQQLTAAGFDRRRLELARELTSPDPSIREQLAEALPRIEGIDAKPWLIWLSRDERAEVRLAAITVMATINDPEMLRRIEDMARRDPDPRVQRQGERLSELRGGVRSRPRR